MNIGIVVVTYNRLSELEKTLRLYDGQTLLPAYILAVDNHSTDGTAEFLNEWQRESGPVPHRVISLARNMGGSGGFYAGTAAAQRMEADWIWLADDDAYPAPDALEALSAFADRHPDLMAQTAALCTKNCGDAGIALGHRCRVRKTPLGTQFQPVSAAEYDKEYFPVDVYSFVGAVVRRDVFLEAGLPRRDYFIYADDNEHALRVRRCGEILCVPAALVYHRDNNSYSRAASWRDYYATRNILLTYRYHLGPWATAIRAARRFLTACRSLNPEKIQLFATAIRDAKIGVTGLHPVYRPGWQPKRRYDR